MVITEEKIKLRKRIKELKGKQNPELKKKMSANILKSIEQSGVFQEAKVVMAYWSMDDEVGTHEFLLRWYTEKTMLLPVVSGNKLAVKQFTGTDSLRVSKRLGIYEPAGDLFREVNEIQLIIVPGVAYDKAGNRLGRGMGFYDGFLKNSNAYKIGICFNFQLVPSVPVSLTDMKVDEVISF